MIALGASVATAFAQITPTLVYKGEQLDAALNVNSDGIAELSYASANRIGNDVEIVILNKQCVVEKQFTLKNVLSTYGEYYKIYDFEISSFDTYPDVIVSRNFFMKNDKWCVVIRHDQENTQIYSVIDEDGNMLGEFPDELPDGSGFVGIYLSEISHGIPYMMYNYENYEDYDNEFDAIYTFTGKAGIEPTMVSSFKSAYPNPLPAGEAFNVSLPQPADDATFFCVTDMKGRQVCRRKVAPGETTYSLTGSRFSRGHYVYTVIYGDGTTASGRLMAE